MRTHAFATALLCALCACREPQPMPTGDWGSDNGRADISIVQDEGGGYSAIVYHRISGGGTCPIAYPVVETAAGAYIQAEGRIVLSFDTEKDALFLSPGGAYHRKSPSPDRNGKKD